MRGLAWWALRLVVVLAVAAVMFVVEKNSLQVTSPEDLKGKHECTNATLGCRHLLQAQDRVACSAVALVRACGRRQALWR
jgi:hypothetical protein